MPAAGAASVDLAGVPLSALIAKSLVAFTIEADNEFETRLAAAGHGDQLSLIAWFRLLQFLSSDGRVTVADLMARTYTTLRECASTVALLERWGFATFELPAGSPPPPLKKSGLGRGVVREGWGNGSGVGADWSPRLTAKGQRAAAIWPEALAKVASGWDQRFSASIGDVRKGLVAVAAGAGVLLPDGLPTSPYVPADWKRLPKGRISSSEDPTLPVALGRALLALTIDYESKSTVPLQLAANTLRVLTSEGVPAGEIAARTGLPDQVASTQVSAIVRSKHAAMVSAAGRGKSIQLTAAGLKAQSEYAALTESQGGEPGNRLRKALVAMLTTTHDGELAIRTAFVPSTGTRRAGTERPAAGRITVGAAARTRNRQFVAQTKALLTDPLTALPHYPVWDGNRHLGP